MLLVASVAASALVGIDGQFALWKAQFGKAYASVEEEASARKAYAQNDAAINAHNGKKLSYTLGHNEFSDMMPEEFYATYAGSLFLNKAPKNMQRALIDFNASALPNSIDWVSKGAVTPVKDQGRCGSCWAFSTTGSLEGAYQIATGKLVPLSEEDLVQCDRGGIDNGCQGGLMDNAFEWVEENGIATEATYPYTSGNGVSGDCDSAKSKPAVTLTGYTDVPKGDEEALRAAVAKQPVSIAIEADRTAFQFYKSGVLDSAACGTHLDHGVLIVGFGTDSSLGKDYWKVKNSWGASWGEDGFIRMVRGKNQCGLSDSASYPTGVKAVAPSPPGPSPPSPPPAKTHYGNPKDGCMQDETELQISGVGGVACAKKCSWLPWQHCPKDVPAGVTAEPECSVRAEGHKMCTLKCNVGNDAPCGPEMKCIDLKMGGSGFCGYTNSSLAM